MRVASAGAAAAFASKDRSGQLAVLREDTSDDDAFFFTEFLTFCSGCLSSVAPKNGEIEDEDYNEFVGSPYELADAEAVFQEKLEYAKDVDPSESWSCDSSIYSGSGIFSEVKNVQVVVDPRLRPPVSPSRSVYRHHKGASSPGGGLHFISEDDASVATLASEGSTSTAHLDPPAKLPSFLNSDPSSSWKAVEAPIHLDPHSHLLPPRYRRPDPPTQNQPSNSNFWDGIKDDRSCKTEGAKVNVRNKHRSQQPYHHFEHRILGTSIHDETTKPQVLTMSIMDSMQPYLPYSKQGEGFWLKYSMVRDGANLRTVLDKTKRSSYTILAVETLDGEVFGAFTAKPWHITRTYYGTPESFLWRLKKRRKGSQLRDATKQQQGDGDVEVFRFACNNKNIQLCNVDRIAVGGGCPDDESVVSDELSHVKMTEWGFGLSFGRDLQQGTSHPCMTFNSPSLARKHSDGSRFEVSNMEFWTLTPCISLEEAQRMERSKEMVGSSSQSLASW